ncbi:LD-carboxypeptidase, partial [Saccharothrix sp. NPDC042600]|uniref:S66 peptidase family protein n=1 Tax=Saccharothrix sp. NPDC042600 TaxID=3154492 RepID=UPI0033C7DE04
VTSVLGTAGAVVGATFTARTIGGIITASPMTAAEPPGPRALRLVHSAPAARTEPTGRPGRPGDGLLRAGDRVALVAPAGPAAPGMLRAGTAWLEAWGLEVVPGKHLTDTHPTLPHLAGTDADRAADLTEALTDPATTAVFCARGGYGCQRVLDLVDWTAVENAPPKVFVGSSDTTVLHDRLTRLGRRTWFGPMPATPAFVHDGPARDHLRRALFTGDPGPYRGTVLVPGTATGPATGGTLTLLDTPPPPGAIVWLEDVDEPPYRLDRMLTALLRRGWFHDVAGIALGSFTGCGDLTDVHAVLHDRLAGLGVPVVADIPFGHCAAQRTIPLGVTVHLDHNTVTTGDRPSD